MAKAYRKPNPAESPFLGILEGRRARAKAAAAAQAEEEKRKTLLLTSQLAAAGFDPEKQKAEATQKIEETKILAVKEETKASTNLYLIVGGIVALLIGGIILIMKYRKK